MREPMLVKIYIDPVCVRPMPMTGEQDRDRLRVNDVVRCACGRETCRDVDVKGDRDA